ncbi:gap junction alpha-4 protein [Hippocampus comes]|uniref:Gap junction protein n=1 Tax=Hippocampus comes TaxID=109280 RepID=A0A3Q2XTB2_HIPCM|nr:PREDICTED: gap junction alpha-4 protein-like [Hippocampus comes]XP_019731200.1 PREDICTED: gap junction alpha-4 protein-like [Hippocampus comes]
MSRADWSFLEHLLEEGQEYSTGIGRVWLTVLFLFRMLVLGTAVESAWDDEQADFICNTRQPGCTAVCYDKAFPISHFRYFVLQVIFVSTPTIFYFGYVAIRSGKGDVGKEESKPVEEGGASQTEPVTERQKDGKGSGAERSPPEAPKLKGKLLCAYTFSILLKVLLEVGFILGLWFLYDGFLIEAKFECVGFPCPHTVDCFVSRPTEKTIFTIYTQAIAAVSLLLNLIELLHLLQLAISHRLKRRYRAHRPRSVPVTEAAARPQAREETPEPYNNGSLPVSVPGQAACYTNPCESFGDVAITVKWEPAAAGSDVLPSYTNCMEAARTSRSPRKHYGQKAKNNRGGASKQKHYV